MRAWRMHSPGGPEGLRLEACATAAPGPGQLAVRVHAAAINFSDTLMIADRYQVKPPWPFTPGQEIAGVVSAADESGAWRVGARVASKALWGGFAEECVVDARMAIAIPDSLGFAAAATLPVVWPTAWIALHDRAAIRAGETLLVHAAAGGVGSAAVQLGKAAGARVIAVVGDAGKTAACVEAGAAHVIASSGWTDDVLALTANRGADVVFDPVGGDATDRSLKCLARGGRLLIVGFASGRIPEIKANRLLLRNASALGVYWSHDHERWLVEHAIDTILEMHATRRVRLAASRAYAFEDLPAALDDLAARRTVGKCVIEVRQ
jgi:NADPH:quinone reductase